MEKIFLLIQSWENNWKFTYQFSTYKISLEILPLSFSTINYILVNAIFMLLFVRHLKRLTYLSLLIPKSFFISPYWLYVRSHCNFYILPFTFIPCLFVFRTWLKTPDKSRKKCHNNQTTFYFRWFSSKYLKFNGLNIFFNVLYIIKHQGRKFRPISGKVSCNKTN